MPSAAADPRFSVAGLAVIVTGAARGNGAAIASGFHAAGASVLAVDRLDAPVPDDARRRALRIDLAAGSAAEAVVEAALGAFGRVDVLVNNAGIAGIGQPAYADETFAAILEVNLAVPFRLARAAAALMAERGGGAIINITSLGAHQGFPDNPAYQAAKAGLGQLTRALALDFGAKGVRVNNIVPGYMRTAMTAKSHADPVLKAERDKRMILPRWGAPDDLVGPALFLASPAAAYITGIDLPVDGGWLARGL